jgi:hypothetical protein
MHRFIALALFLALTACVSASHNSLVERGEAGDAAAQFELGKSYARGAGVKQDFAIAENWFAKAAVTDPVYIGRIIDFYGDDFGDLERSVAWLGENSTTYWPEPRAHTASSVAFLPIKASPAWSISSHAGLPPPTLAKKAQSGRRASGI